MARVLADFKDRLRFAEVFFCKKHSYIPQSFGHVPRHSKTVVRGMPLSARKRLLQAKMQGTREGVDHKEAAWRDQNAERIIEQRNSMTMTKLIPCSMSCSWATHPTA